MTKSIIGSTIIGVLLGYFFLPQSFIDISGTLLTVGLSLLLIFVGIDLGMTGEVIGSFKKMGFKILLFPIVTAIGTLVGAFAVSFILPINAGESLAIASGFGWYTFAPIILSEYSDTISAISFMHNVMREVFGLMLIPIVAKYMGFVETISLPGAGAGDVGMPIVERETNPEVSVYAFVTGWGLSLLVPILVPIFVGL